MRTARISSGGISRLTTPGRRRAVRYEASSAWPNTSGDHVAAWFSEPVLRHPVAALQRAVPPVRVRRRIDRGAARRTRAGAWRVDTAGRADRARPRAALRGRRPSRWHDVAAVRSPPRLFRVCGPGTRHRASDPCSEWIEPADRVAVARAQDPASYPTLRPSRHRPAGQDVRQALRLRADRTCPRGAWTFSRPCRTCGHMSCVPVGVLPAAGWVSAWRSGQPAARRASANAARLLRTTRPGASSTCHARPRVSCRVRK